MTKMKSPEPRAQSPEPRAQSPEPRAQSPEPRAQSPAFTLSELLISVSILGVIAAMTIPSILTSVEDIHKRAVFKETIGNVQEAYLKGWQEGSMNPNTNLYSFMIARLNCTRIASNANTAGMWIGQIDGGDGSRAGCQLPNGAVVLMDDSPAQWVGGGIYLNTLGIDYNGEKLPNAAYSNSALANSDRMFFRANPGNADVPYAGITMKTGMISAQYQLPWIDLYNK